MLHETLMHITEDHYGVVELVDRTQSLRAMDHGHWVSSVTALVARLQADSQQSSIRQAAEAVGRETLAADYWLSESPARSKDPIITSGAQLKPNSSLKPESLTENMMKAITERQNHVTGHWLKRRDTGQ